MKTYNIVLVDWVAQDAPEFIESIQTADHEDIKKRLTELQKGYCEDETPDIRKETFASNGKQVLCLVAYSDSDYSHICPIGTA